MCDLIKTFISRQGVILMAASLFLLFTYVRVRRGIETRDFLTFCADSSKQAAQQMFGGALMALLGVVLAQHSSNDALSWYAAEYPFEIVITTAMTWPLKKLSMRWASCACLAGGKTAMEQFGCYRDSLGTFRVDWYFWQLFQALFMIGIPARLVSAAFILCVASLHNNPLSYIAQMWDESGLTCFQKTVMILYVTPVIGDALQFIIVDTVQKFVPSGSGVDVSDGGVGAESVKASTHLLGQSDANGNKSFNVMV